MSRQAWKNFWSACAHLILFNRPVTTDAQQRWRCRRVSRQSVCLVGSSRRGRKAFRFTEDLNGALLLLPGRSSDIRVQFDWLCEELGISVRLYAEVDDMAMLRLMARLRWRDAGARGGGGG